MHLPVSALRIQTLTDLPNLRQKAGHRLPSLFTSFFICQIDLVHQRDEFFDYVGWLLLDLWALKQVQGLGGCLTYIRLDIARSALQRFNSPLIAFEPERLGCFLAHIP